MKTILRIYRNNRPDHLYKYTLVIDNKVVETNSKEEIKIILDLNGMKMYLFWDLVDTMIIKIAFMYVFTIKLS